MKCANCTDDSRYIYKITRLTTVEYCDKHLPKFLEERKRAGLLSTTESYDSVVSEGLASISLSDNSVNEEELPKPPKKAAKKKAE